MSAELPKAGKPSPEFAAIAKLAESAEMRNQGEEMALRHVESLMTAYRDGIMGASETIAKLVDFLAKVVEARTN